MKISDLRSLVSVINRLFMKLFKTNAIDTVTVCQEYVDFELPSVVIEKRKAYICMLFSYFLVSYCPPFVVNKGLHKYPYMANNIPNDGTFLVC